MIHGTSVLPGGLGLTARHGEKTISFNCRESTFSVGFVETDSTAFVIAVSGVSVNLGAIVGVAALLICCPEVQEDRKKQSITTHRT